MFAPVKARPDFVDVLVARTALGRLGTPDDVAEAVHALLQADWVTGQVLAVDGGLSLSSPIDR